MRILHQRYEGEVTARQLKEKGEISGWLSKLERRHTTTKQENQDAATSGAPTCKKERTREIELFCWQYNSKSREVHKGPSVRFSGVLMLLESLLSRETFCNRLNSNSPLPAP